MTEADGSRDPLRVPPWLPDSEPAGDAPEIPEPLPSLPPAERPPAHAAADDDDDAGLDIGFAAAPEGADDPSRRRMAALIISSALVVVAVLAIGVLRDDDDAQRPAAPRPSSPRPAGATAPLPAATSEPAEPSPSVSPADSSSATASATAAPTRSETRAPTRSPTPIRFGPVTFEAEAPGNTLAGSAWADAYPGASGGRIVRNLGDWGDRRQGDGVLRFEDVTVPVAGTYSVQVFHVNIDNEPSRTLVVVVDDDPARSFTLAGGSTCCTASTLRLDLRKGRNSITFGNPAGHAPSVDRIVVSLP